MVDSYEMAKIFLQAFVLTLLFCCQPLIMTVRADVPLKPDTSVRIVRRIVPLNAISPTFAVRMFAPYPQNPYLENLEFRKMPTFPSSPTTILPWCQLPRGIQSIKPNDSEKTLELVGVESAVNELQQSLRILDHPLRLVEIEIQILEINKDELKIVFSQGKITSLSQKNHLAGAPVMVVNSSLTLMLSKLIWGRKAALSSSQKFLTYQSAPAQSALFPTNPRLSHMMIQKSSDFIVPGSGRESFLFSAWPTVSHDDTINLSMVFNRVALRGKPRLFEKDDLSIKARDIVEAPN